MAMQLPPIEELKFGGDVIVIAMRRYNAGCGSGSDQELFMASLWREYCDAGEPKPQRKWIIERLKNEFLYVDKPPVWVGAEPNWAFHEGKPMVFIYQTPLTPRTEVALTHLGVPSVLYTFGIRIFLDGTYRLMYKIIEEHPSMRGTTGVQSNPIWIGGEPDS